MVIFVILNVLIIVKIVYVIFRMEFVLLVSWDGLGDFVIEELFFLYNIFKSVLNMYLILYLN